MFSLKKLLSICLAATLLSAVAACSDDDDDTVRQPGEFAVAVSVYTGPGSFDYTYYVVPAVDLMTGKITTRKNGVEQAGYTDYTAANGKIISFGGSGEQSIKSIEKTDDDRVVLNGDKSVFPRAISGITQVDNNTLLAASFAGNEAAGTSATFYTLNVNTNTVTSTVNVSQTALSKLDWVNYSGMEVKEGKAYVSFYLNNTATFATQYTDTAYVAVYNYPAMTLDKILKTTAVGPFGGFGTQNGLIKTSSDDIYAVSATNPANGFSQKTKQGGILKIAKGSSNFDANYFFAIEGISHIKYLSGNLALAEVLTAPIGEQKQWADGPLKTVIIDLVNKTVKDVQGIPSHMGNGGRSFPVLWHDNLAYMTIAESGTTFVYRIDPSTLTATKGAEVEGTFVAGVFHF